MLTIFVDFPLQLKTNFHHRSQFSPELMFAFYIKDSKIVHFYVHVFIGIISF